MGPPASRPERGEPAFEQANCAAQPAWNGGPPGIICRAPGCIPPSLAQAFLQSEQFSELLLCLPSPSPDRAPYLRFLLLSRGHALLPFVVHIIRFVFCLRPLAWTRRASPRGHPVQGASLPLLAGSQPCRSVIPGSSARVQHDSSHDSTPGSSAACHRATGSVPDRLKLDRKRGLGASPCSKRAWDYGAVVVRPRGRSRGRPPGRRRLRRWRRDQVWSEQSVPGKPAVLLSYVSIPLDGPAVASQ